jgi:hypothetical protein
MREQLADDDGEQDNCDQYRGLQHVRLRLSHHGLLSLHGRRQRCLLM